ncbi:MAG TPA: HIT family protein [Methanobacteriaceae archaeon]|nr:HIT family protein [Methanobacteriaceae archaeon]
MKNSCEYCQIDGGYGDLIWETDYWLIYLAPSQRYLGTCVVALKRHVTDLCRLKDEEWRDFAIIVRKMELSLNKLLKPTLFNWSCFKNATFRTNNPRPEIHWHLIPRYGNEIEYEGLKFKDRDFGYIPQPIKRKIPPEVYNALKNEIKADLNDR